MNECPGLSSSTVDGKRDVACRLLRHFDFVSAAGFGSGVQIDGLGGGYLHEETVEDGAVLAIVVEAIGQALIALGQRSVGAPDNALQVSDVLE